MKNIDELAKVRESTIDDLDDEIASELKRLRVLEQQKDDAWYDFELKMYNRCWDMVHAVIDLHFPDIEIKYKDKRKVRKLFSNAVGIKLRRKDL